jgi:choline dehydrogenase
VLAARLSEDADRSVLLIEAGPDYGHLGEGRWPADLLDASQCAESHDWGYGVDTCCRVVGGCSAHNGCLVVRGTPADYDCWAGLTGDDGWSFRGMRPHLEGAEREIGTRDFTTAEVGTWTRSALAGWAELGEPAVAVNEPAPGAGLIPVNRRGRVRLSAALAYLDPARDRPNLSIMPEALAVRVAIAGSRATGVVVWHRDVERLVEAGTVILASGAYGSPAILLRSGIGPARELERVGVPVCLDLPQVGRNLHDHPCFRLPLEPRAGLADALADDDSRGAVTHVQAMLKAASSLCPAGTFDLQVLADTGRGPTHEVSLIPVDLKPASRGAVRLRSADAADLPLIDRRLFTDPGGRDLRVLMEGVGKALDLAATGPIAAVARPVAAPDEATVAREAFALFHPVGTCAMGSVVDAGGRVAGVEGLRVCDASIIPEVPRANTHLSVLAVAEAIAARIRRPAMLP